MIDKNGRPTQSEPDLKPPPTNGEGGGAWADFLELAGAGLFEMDEDGVVIFANATLEALFGVARGSMVDEDCYGVKLSTGSPLLCTVLEECKARGRFAGRPPVKLKTAAVGTKWVEATAFLMEEPAGSRKIRGIINSVEDWKLAERELETLYRAVDVGIDGMALMEVEGRLLYVNPAFAGAFGYDEPQSLIGKEWLELCDEEGRERMRGEIFPELVRKGAWHGETVGRRKNGSRFPQAVSLTLFDDNHLVVCFARDITERLKTEAGLARLRELKLTGRLVAGLTHEIRNPLFAIIALTRALQRNVGESPELAHLADEIVEQAQRISRLTKGLVELGTTAQIQDRQDIFLADLLEEAVVSACNEIPGSKGRILVKKPVAEAMVRVHWASMVSAVARVLNNALRFSPNDGKIEILVERVDAEVRLMVRDAGPGIEPELFKTLFAPFTTGNSGSFGLGLAIAKRTLEDHGGRIWVENNEPESGCTVTMVLPVSQ